MPDSLTLAQTLVRLSSEDNAETQINEFFSYLENNNLTGMLPQIKQHVQRIIEKQNDFNTLIITSRHELSAQEINEVKGITKADEQAEVRTELSDIVLGSFQAQYQGKLYDGSLQSKVVQMNNTLNVSL